MKLIDQSVEFDKKFSIIYDDFKDRRQAHKLFFYVFVIRRMLFVLIGYYMYDYVHL